MSVVGFGLVVPTQQAWCSVSAVERIAREAESLAFDSLWLPDHLVAPLGDEEEVGFRDSNYDWMRSGDGSSRRVTPAQYYGSTGWFLESYSTLAFLAGITKRVRIGSSVIVLPYRNPVVQARMAQTIDVLSRGRLVLGFGAGHIPAEAAALGVPYEDRGRRTEEYLLVMKALWSDERAEFHGDLVDFDELLTLGRPAQRPHPPIYYGGMGRRAIQRAVEHCDGWLVTPSSLESDELALGIEYAREQERASGRSRPFDIVLMSVARLGLSDARAREAWSEDELGAYYSLPPNQEPEELVETLEPHLALGAGGLIVSFPAPDVDTYLDQAARFSRDVLPRLSLRALES
jgi:probable F420-dependent oxidoreductase